MNKNFYCSPRALIFLLLILSITAFLFPVLLVAQNSKKEIKPELPFWKYGVDTDHDGFVDPLDPCPTEPEDKDGFQDEGCPDPDNDKDYIADNEDKCPDKHGNQLYFGCPEVDRDGDSVSDLFDNCPDIAGTVENGGCTTPQLFGIRFDGFHLALEKEQKIYFKINKAVIHPKSYTVLDEVVQILKTHPEFTRIHIEGHSYGRYGEQYSMSLSKKRAESVRDYLLSKGIDYEGLYVLDYGETRPIVSNDTQEGRATNRRIEFVIVEINRAPIPTLLPENKR